MLTVADAAMILKVAPDTVQNWIRAGALAAFKLPGGREYRIRWECLENLMSDGPGTTSALDTQDEAARILSVARGKMKTGGADGQRLPTRQHALDCLPMPDGRREQRPTRLPWGKRTARAVLEAIEGKIEAGEALGEAEGPITVTRYFNLWLEDRKARVSTWRNDESRFGSTSRSTWVTCGWMKCVLGMSPTCSGRSSCEPILAPRTLRNIHAMLRAMFRDGMIADIVRENPCVLGVHHLGKVVDKDPNWRHTAIFTRDEEEQVLSDERIPEDRRAFYALLFLGALRFGEAAARRWRDYDPEASPR